MKLGFALVLGAIDFALCLNVAPVRRIKSPETCTQKVEGCESNLEVKSEGACVMADKLPQYKAGADVEQSIANFQSMLTKYYGDISVLEKMLNISDAGRAVLVEKMRKAVRQDKKFVVAAIGSSVTAAHDNCQLDGYATQLEILLTPLFKQAGVSFESRNGGIGGACGDSFFDQVPCLSQVVGEDVDVTSFSWDYWADNPEFQEHFIRTSLSMPKSPMPLLITLNNAHYPSHDQFSALYGHLGYHALAATSTTPAAVPSRDSDSKPKFGFKGDGWHTVSRLGENFPQGHCRRESTSVLWRNWHGGPMLYQLISDAMGWTYVKALKEALGPASTTVVAPPATLPAGLLSNITSAPRCISFTKPNIDNWKGSPSVKLIEAKSEPVTVESQHHRKEMIPDSETNEKRCEHLDVCGVAKSNLMTLDLQAKHTTPLTHGKLVVCIGGGPPSSSGDSLMGWLEDESMQSIASLPPAAVFPRCTTGSLQSIQVDGHELDLKSAKSWAEGAEGATKCGSFTLADKSARLVTVRSPECGVTHVFAM